jgi:hypothetical protein
MPLRCSIQCPLYNLQRANPNKASFLFHPQLFPQGHSIPTSWYAGPQKMLSATWTCNISGRAQTSSHIRRTNGAKALPLTFWLRINVSPGLRTPSAERKTQFCQSTHQQSQVSAISIRSVSKAKNEMRGRVLTQVLFDVFYSCRIQGLQAKQEVRPLL